MKTEASVYLEQIRNLSEGLGRMIDDIPAEQFNQRPEPHLNTVGWNYFHLLRVWDLYFNSQLREWVIERNKGAVTSVPIPEPDNLSELWT
jgi:hypothetical protein